MKTGLILLLSLFSLSTHAFKPHTANYQLSINGLKIAEEVRTLHQLEDNYFYTANAKTSGVAALIKDYSIAASSSFKLNAQGVDSINYQIMEQEDKKVTRNNAIDISSDNSTVISTLTKTQPKIATWKTKKGNIVDPLSLFLALSYDIKQQPKKTEFNYQVADGKSINQHHYKKTNDQTITLNGETLNTIKIERIKHEGKNMQAYFLPDYQYLPVLIEQTKGSRNYTYKINNFESLAAK